MKDQPLPADASPTALSPDYVVDPDPEKDEKDPKDDPADYPADRGDNDDNESSNNDDHDDDVEKDEEEKEEEEHLAPADPSDDDDDEDPEEDPVDYPADGGDDGDDEEESSKDDEDDEMDIEANEEEKEEHPAPTDSVVVAPTAADQAPSTEETEPFETDESAATPPPHPVYHTTARIFILALVPMSAWTDSEVQSMLTMRSLLRTKHMLRMLHLWPSHLKVTLPPWKRLDIALGPRYEVGESSSGAAARPARCFRADYGFVATVDREIMCDPEREVGYRITDSWDEIHT
nr:hypothetical protein [Tanacetum cinerariifolium]